MGPSIDYGFSALTKVNELEKRVAKLEAVLSPLPVSTAEQPEPLLTPSPQLSLEEEIREAVNRHSMENVSNVPDFILAHYLIGCLGNFNEAVKRRTAWYQPQNQKLSP